MLHFSAQVEEVGAAQQDVHVVLEEAGEVGQAVVLLAAGEEVGDVGDQAVVVADGVIGRNHKGQVVDGQDVAVGADGQGRTGFLTLGGVGVGVFVGQGQGGAGGLDGAGVVEDDLVNTLGDGVGLKDADVELLEVGVVLGEVVEVTGLEGYAQPLERALS